MIFGFAGIRARARVPSPIAERLAPFRCDGGSPVVEFDIDPLRVRRVPFDWRPRIRGSEGAARVSSTYLSVELRRRGGRWRARGRAASGLPAWDSLLRATWGWILSGRGGLLLHASGAVVDGRALIFPGVSGAGKSTLAIKAGPERMLSDDTLAVRRRAGRWEACSTPFISRIPPTRFGVWPLRAICFPVKHSAVAAPTGPASATARILRNVIWFSRETAPARRIVRLAADLAARVPAFDLGSFRSDSFDTILARLNGLGSMV
jgi:hypothetical protein